MRFLVSIGVILTLIPSLSYCHPKKADLIIFSYDRPLQLYALLESVGRFISGLDVITVIYRSSADEYASAYAQVHVDFPAVQFIAQGAEPTSDFKPILLKTVESGPGDYLICAVDDIIVTDYIDLSRCIDALEQTQAYGFYLRLGKNITLSYGNNQSISVPALRQVMPEIYGWLFYKQLKNTGDWYYSHTVDMALYRKKDLLKDWRAITFTNPNTLESRWHGRLAHKADRRLGLCYEHSKIVNIPLNLVQQEFNNENMAWRSVEDLLALFNQGLKIDISALYQYDNRSVHMDYEPRLIMREC